MKETESEMHEIKNKRRPRAVANKKEGLHLRARRRMSRTSRSIVTLCSVLLLLLGVYGVGSAFFKVAQRNTVNLNYGSASVPVEEGEVYSLTGGYAPVDVFARLNWKFSRQSLWYAEMHGTVDTVIQQSITTYKQYEEGILISADLTESSLIKSASQFCYLKDKDRVIWRKPVSKNYDGLNTAWNTGEPYNIMTIGGEHGFKAVNGLPAYELSVYVIAEDTVASASPVTVTEDGKFRITYDLKPETWQEEVDGVLTTKGAPAYYINQMIFTGGLTTPPEFKAISVTFTFDENWQVFQTDIEEKYSAKYGPIAAPCVSTSTTKYEYNTERAHSDAYEEYFYQYAEGEVNNKPVEKEITALDCLAEGFGSVLTEPTVLDLDLKIAGTPYRGIVDLDLSKADFTAFDLSSLTAKVKLGALSLWVEQGSAYLDYGGLKFSLETDELIALVKDLIAEQNGGQAEEGDILTALANGEFTLYEGRAELHSQLPLLGLNIPVDFYFTVGEDHEIAVEKVTADISIGNSLAMGAQLGFGKEHLPALNASEKAGFVPLMPYASELIELFSADVMHVDLSYQSDAVALSGGLDLRLNGLTLAGEVQADLSLDGIELSKKIKLSYSDGMLYLDLDGIKLRLTAEEGIALIGQYITLPDTDALPGLDLGALINTLLSDDFAALFSSSEQNGLLLAVKGSELLSSFGVNFALGDVTLTVGEEGLSAAVSGAEVRLTAGTDVVPDTAGYTPILPYIRALTELFSNEDLALSFSYTAGDFTAAGEITLNVASKAAAGELVLGYGEAQKTLSVIYEGNFLYLRVDGLQVKANAEEAVRLISSLTGAENDPDAKALINKVLGLDFGSVISLSEENDTLTVLVEGTELLHALGVGFDLNTVTLRIAEGSIKAEALGAEITVKGGEKFCVNTDGYLDFTPLFGNIAAILADRAVALCGDVVLTLNDFEIDVEVENAVLSFEEGIKFHLHTFLSLQKKVKFEVFLGYENGTVQVACGALGVKIVTSELGSLKEALLNFYGTLYPAIGNMLETGENPLPSPDDLKELLKNVSFGGDPSASIWAEIVNALTFATTEHDVSVRYGDVLARLFFPADPGFLGVELNGALGDPSIRLDGMLYLQNVPSVGTDEGGKNMAQFPEMPKIDYLGTEQFEAVIGYLGSAADLLNATDLTLALDGEVLSTDEAYREYGGVKYRINASMATHRGEGSLIHLNVDGKNLWVDPDVFAHLSINITAKSAGDSSLYLDLFLLDGAPEADAEGTGYGKDGMLDFYVTLSQFGPAGTAADAVAGYEPLRLYAPSGEILTLLSSVLPVLGIDADILNSYMIGKWLSLENVAQLKAFGSVLSPLLSKLLGAKEIPQAPSMPSEPSQPSESSEPLLIEDYLKELSVTQEGLSIELNSEKLYGVKGLQNVRATLAKEADTREENSYTYGKFTSLELLNIYDRAGTENTSLTGTVDYTQITPDVPEGEYQSFPGADRLILALAKSATHGVNEAGEQAEAVISGEEQPHRYQLNRNFYLDGTIQANLLGLVDVTIDLVAISVNIDENGEFGIGLRLQYGGVALGLVAINGDSTVDITIKGGMVYMKRVQTTRRTAFRNDPIDPITLYRVMPLQNFTGDLLGQLSFILNFGDLINNAIQSGGSGGGEGSTTPSETVDFGTTLKTVLQNYTFTQEGNTEKWHLEINGSSFSNDILGDVVLEMTATDGLLKQLYVPKLSVNIPAGAIKLGLTASLDLIWHNAGGISDGTEEQIDRELYRTLSDSRQGFGGMTEQLNAESGWTERAEDGSEKYRFLEGKVVTVSYKCQTNAGGTEELGTQKAIVSTGNDGFAQNTMYSILSYPDLSGYPESVETYIAWDKVDVGSTLGSDDTVYAREYKKLYLVTFRSDVDLGNAWSYDEAEDMYFLKWDMEYGATVDIGGKKQTVTDQNTTFVILKKDIPPFEGGKRAGNWQKIPRSPPRVQHSFRNMTPTPSSTSAKPPSPLQVKR